MESKSNVLSNKSSVVCAITFIFLATLLYAKGGLAQSKEDLGRYWVPPKDVCVIELHSKQAEQYGFNKVRLVEIVTMEDWRRMVVPLYAQVETEKGTMYRYQGYIDQQTGFFHYCKPPPQFAANRRFDTGECFLIANN